ncbi:MAG: type II toxin-antitoxin system VapC family toxin, partial [Nitrospirota bacterium]|nr:type II toxin-antitoxin system VapC family toxin [Nitrospirota bacterium]
KVVPFTADHAYTAGVAHAAYRKAGGKRQRILADFLIGAHAFHEADQLLTRDRGFYRRYFSGLAVLSA